MQFRTPCLQSPLEFQSNKMFLAGIKYSRNSLQSRCSSVPVFGSVRGCSGKLFCYYTIAFQKGLPAGRGSAEQTTINRAKVCLSLVRRHGTARHSPAPRPSAPAGPARPHRTGSHGHGQPGGRPGPSPGNSPSSRRMKKQSLRVRCCYTPLTPPRRLPFPALYQVR